MPFARLLPDNTVSAFQSLGSVSTDGMEDFRWQCPLVAAPIIAVPPLAIGFPVGTRNQFPNQFISLFSGIAESGYEIVAVCSKLRFDSYCFSATHVFQLVPPGSTHYN